MPTQINQAKERGTLYTILSDGKFHTEVTQDTEGAIRRDWESKDKKEKGTKWEHVATSITGRIVEVGVYEGNYGKQVVVSIGDNSVADTTIYLSTQSRYAEDFLKKLRNIDHEKDVTLTPFSFEDEKTGKPRQGISVTQEKEGEKIKIPDFYHTIDVVTERKTEINGYPVVPEEAKDWSSDDWKMYYYQAMKFMLTDMQKSPLYNRASKSTAMKPSSVSSTDYPQEEIHPDDIPF